MIATRETKLRGESKGFFIIIINIPLNPPLIKGTLIFISNSPSFIIPAAMPYMTAG